MHKECDKEMERLRARIRELELECFDADQNTRVLGKVILKWDKEEEDDPR